MINNTLLRKFGEIYADDFRPKKEIVEDVLKVCFDNAFDLNLSETLYEFFRQKGLLDDVNEDDLSMKPLTFVILKTGEGRVTRVTLFSDEGKIQNGRHHLPAMTSFNQDEGIIARWVDEEGNFTRMDTYFYEGHLKRISKLFFTKERELIASYLTTGTGRPLKSTELEDRDSETSVGFLDKKRYVKKMYELGKLMSQKTGYLTGARKSFTLHSFNDEPASVDFDQEGMILQKMWALDGNLHRGSDLPAIEVYDEETGQKITEKWLLNGTFYRASNKPTIVRYEEGKKRSEEWAVEEDMFGSIQWAIRGSWVRGRDDTEIVLNLTPSSVKYNTETGRVEERVIFFDTELPIREEGRYEGAWGNAELAVEKYMDFTSGVLPFPTHERVGDRVRRIRRSKRVEGIWSRLSFVDNTDRVIRTVDGVKLGNENLMKLRLVVT